MRGGWAISVVLFATASSLAVAEHASSRSTFEAPVSTMSDTTRGTRTPQSVSLRMPSGRGASWQDFSRNPNSSGNSGNNNNGNNNNQNNNNNNGSNNGGSGGNNGSGSGSNLPTTYKPNDAAQKQMSESGSKTVEKISKMPAENGAVVTSLTDNFLKQVNSITSQKPEEAPALGQLAARVGSTSGSGQTATGFDSLIKESNQLWKTREDILTQIAARQLVQTPPQTPAPTPEPISISQRIEFAMKAGRPFGGGDPTSRVPAGFDVNGPSAALDKKL